LWHEIAGGGNLTKRPLLSDPKNFAAWAKELRRIIGTPEETEHRLVA
jgi:hypothetical protein